MALGITGIDIHTYLVKDAEPVRTMGFAVETEGNRFVLHTRKARGPA